MLSTEERNTRVGNGVRDVFTAAFIRATQSTVSPPRDMSNRLVNSLLHAQQSLDPDGEEDGVPTVPSPSQGSKPSKWRMANSRWAKEGDMDLVKALRKTEGSLLADQEGKGSAASKRTNSSKMSKSSLMSIYSTVREKLKLGRLHEIVEGFADPMFVDSI